MSEREPFGHRGHPTEVEMRRASRAADRLEAAIKALVEQGFSEEEAEAFIAGQAMAIAASRLNETWTSADSARRTVQGIRIGHGAKEWSVDAIFLALRDIEDLTAD
jgi:hypothetical protein